jgi:hypothetical protein
MEAKTEMKRLKDLETELLNRKPKTWEEQLDQELELQNVRWCLLHGKVVRS